MQDVPKIVLSRMQGTDADEVHPDADLLTAFAEQSLTAVERSDVMKHLAACGDCRELVALALPENAIPAEIALGRPAGQGWFGWPILRPGLGWGMVAAGLVVVSAVGIMQFRHSQAARMDRATLSARNEVPDTARRQPVAVPAGDVGAETASNYPSKAELTKPPRPPKPDDGVRSSAHVPAHFEAGRRSMSADTAPANSSNSSVTSEQRPLASGSSITDAVTPAPDRDAAMPTSSKPVEVQSAAAAPATAKNEVVDSLITSQNTQILAEAGSSQRDVVKAKPAAPPAMVARSDASAVAGTLQRESASAGAALRWNIGPDGSLQRSWDGGTTWEDVDVNPTPAAARSKQDRAAMKAQNEPTEKKYRPQSTATPVFRAVSAMGAEVWAGGSQERLYHSIDSGAHWQQEVPSFAGVALSGDIDGIEFADSQNGTIRTSTREVWTTSDGGQSWRRLQ